MRFPRGAGEPAVASLRSLRGWVAGQVEDQREIEAPAGGYRPEPGEVGEERYFGTTAGEPVSVADLAVAVAEGRVGELQRDAGLSRRRREPPAARREHLLHQG